MRPDSLNSMELLKQDLFSEIGEEKRVGPELVGFLSSRIPRAMFHLWEYQGQEDLANFAGLSIKSLGLLVGRVKKAKKELEIPVAKGQVVALWIEELQDVLLVLFQEPGVDPYGVAAVKAHVELFFLRQRLEEEQGLRQTQKRQFDRRLKALKKSYQDILEDNYRQHRLIQDQEKRHSKNLKDEIKKQTAKLRKANRKLRRAMEAAEAANVAKSEFLARMSHEIRTPLNAILGFTEMLMDTHLSEEQLDYLLTIKRSGEALLSLIDDILDFSKIEAGELTLEQIDFDPEMTAYDVCELIRPKINGKDVEIICRVGDSVPWFVKGDPGRFRQVLINLMGNAAKFTQKGEIELSLEVAQETSQRIKLLVKVRDTGVGIPEDKIGLIFEVFQQAEGSISRKFGGTGLGLSICKQLAKLMGGDVWAESPAPVSYGREGWGPGSVFYFTAWFSKSRKERDRYFREIQLQGKRALIVDDNRASAQACSQILKAAGMEVVLLEEGSKLIKLLEDEIGKDRVFHICIIDTKMPGVDGYELAKEIRKGNDSISRIPLLALSSSMGRDARKCKEAGFNGYLPKPPRPDRLREIVARLLNETTDRHKGSKSQMLVTQHSLREEAKHSVRILLVEDNPVNQKLGTIMLKKAGYHVDVAENGLEALEKYQRAPDSYDLIFMDVQMPEMNGLEATKAIRRWEKRKGLPAVPIVAMTAQAMKGDKDTCLKAGMNDYVSKPIKRELVFQMIKKWIPAISSI